MAVVQPGGVLSVSDVLGKISEASMEAQPEEAETPAETDTSEEEQEVTAGGDEKEESEDDSSEEEEEEQEDDDVEDEDEEEGEVEATPRKRNRGIERTIRALKADRKRMASELAETKRLHQEMMEMSRSGKEQQTDLEKQLAVANRELELMRLGYEQVEEAALSPEERQEKMLLRKLKGELEPKYQEKLKAIEDTISAERKKREEEARLAQAHANANKYLESARSGVSEVLSKADPQDARALKDHAVSMALAWGAHFDLTPDKALKEFNRFAMKYANAISKSKAKSTKVKAPGKMLGGGHAKVKGSSMPTPEELKQSGAKSIFDYMAKKGLANFA